MSIECSECEHDLRGGHDPSCSRYLRPSRAMPERIWAEPPRAGHVGFGEWIDNAGYRPDATEYVCASALNEAREALRSAKAAILTADVMDARHNAAGYLTDRALWHDRAMTIIETALAKIGG